MSPRHRNALDLLVRVDRTRPTPVGRQLEEQLREAIRGGRLGAGSDLPSTRALAADLAVSRGVVVRAYGQLAAEGYLDLRQGANPSVRGVPQPPPDEDGRPQLDERCRIRYDLRPDEPELSRFPRRAWLRSLEQALTTAADAELGFIHARGLPALRSELALYLGRTRGVAADPEQVVVTAGTTNGISLVARALERAGARALAFENPSHALLHGAAAAAGLEVVGVPVDRSGLVTDGLEAVDAAGVVVGPGHQFPTGAALAPERRKALLAWARTRDTLVVEAGLDGDFRYGRPAQPSLQGECPERVVLVGCTAKMLAPGLRIGWLVLPERLVRPVEEELRRAQLQVASGSQLALADFLRRGELDRHLRRMRDLYARRRDTLLRALGNRLPHLPVGGSGGGLHVVLRLRSAEVERAAAERAAKHGVAVGRIWEHALCGYEGPAGLLVGYGAVLEPAIPLAIEELADAVAVAEDGR